MLRGLIVNADDFGQSAGINRGIIEAHEHGIVTSASLMVCGDAAPDAAAYARLQPGLSVGLHVDLCEWACVDGAWRLVYERVDCSNAAAVEKEIERQLSLCRTLLRRNPSHLDSHQHVHLDGPARTVLARLANELGVPLRHASPVRYEGGFYGQTDAGRPLPAQITPDALKAMVRTLRPGFTELGCHPGYAEDVTTMYRDERALEVRALCDARVKRTLREAGVVLMSFADVVARVGPSMHDDDTVI